MPLYIHCNWAKALLEYGLKSFWAKCWMMEWTPQWLSWLLEHPQCKNLNIQTNGDARVGQGTRNLFVQKNKIANKPPSHHSFPLKVGEQTNHCRLFEFLLHPAFLVFLNFFYSSTRHDSQSARLTAAPPSANTMQSWQELRSRFIHQLHRIGGWKLNEIYTLNDTLHGLKETSFKYKWVLYGLKVVCWQVISLRAFVASLKKIWRLILILCNRLSQKVSSCQSVVWNTWIDFGHRPTLSNEDFHWPLDPIKGKSLLSG